MFESSEAREEMKKIGMQVSSGKQEIIKGDRFDVGHTGINAKSCQMWVFSLMLEND